MYIKSYGMKSAVGIGLFALSVLAPIGHSQDRDRRDGGWDSSRNIYTRLEPGMTIPIRLNEAIDVERRDNRVYSGVVDRDIRGDNGRLAIPRGATAELIVRVERDNDLILDLESVVVNGQRYAIQTDRNRVESQRDNSLIGAIVGAVNGGEVRGRAVRVPRDSVVTFRLQSPLSIGVEDRGVDREGHHYHDWYDRDRGKQ